MINGWFGTFYNMVQQALGKPGSVTLEAFFGQLWTFGWIAMVYIFTAVLTAFFTSHYVFRWRTAMNEFYVEHWQRLRHITLPGLLPIIATASHTPGGWYGFTLGITVDNTRGGNCGGVVGLNHPGEGFLSGDHMNGVWFGNKEASAAHQAQMPRVPDGKYNGLVVTPLRSARLDPPDICMFYGTPGQMIYFINGLQFHRYRRYDFTVTGESACADSWGRALATRQTSLSLPCFAERRYGGVADDELLMACPPDEFLRAVEGMGQLGKNGLRYPFPPYGAAMDPAFGMAKSYG